MTILPAESHDGNERSERACRHCPLIKITVHPAVGFPWREWRMKDSQARIALGATPPCLDAEAA